MNLKNHQPKKSAVGHRVEIFLRGQYPRNSAKLIGRQFGVSPATAERWLRGEAPTVAHFEKMAAAFGEPFLREVFNEAFVARDERLERLEQNLSLVTHGLLASAHVAGPASVLPEQSDRSLADRARSWLIWIQRMSRFINWDELRQIVPSPARQELIGELIKTIPVTIPSHTDIYASTEIIDYNYPSEN